MELYLDSADVEEIREACGWGVISGVTTNPSLLARTGGRFSDVIGTIMELVEGPVNVECVCETTDDIVAEAKRLKEVLPSARENLVVKVPMTVAGIAAVSRLSDLGIKTNVTLMFSPAQAILAARAGATFVSPFVGRLDDISHDGMDLVRDIVAIFEEYQYGTRVIAASIRHLNHVVESARAGADIATIPFAVLKAMYRHPLTDAGVEKFLVDWEKLTGGRQPVV